MKVATTRVFVSATVTVMVAIFIMGCGPSQEQLERTMDERIRIALTAIPTSTPIEYPTPLPTPTAVTFPPTATPMPTATAVFITDFNAIYKRFASAVVFIMRDDGYYGAGWLLEPGFILTTYSMVQGRNTVQIKWQRDLQLARSGRVIAFDRQRDIGLISFDYQITGIPGNVLPIPLGRVSVADIGRPIMAIGHAYSSIPADFWIGPPSVIVGVLSQMINVGPSYQHLYTIKSPGLTFKNIEMDAAVPQGLGLIGGPVLDDHGYVVGMITASYIDLGISYAIHVDELKAALPDLKSGKSQ